MYSEAQLSKILKKSTDLVFVEIISTLPLRTVIALYKAGLTRIFEGILFSFKFISQRMTNVTFPSVLEAYQVDERFRNEICQEHVLKRLRGHVVLNCSDLDRPGYKETFLTLINITPGTLFLHITGIDEGRHESQNTDHTELVQKTRARERVHYVSLHNLSGDYTLFQMFPLLIFSYEHDLNDGPVDHYLLFRRWLLNERHAVDVMRSVCETIHKSQDELNEIREETNKEEFEQLLPDLWSTRWVDVVDDFIKLPQ